MMGLSISAPVSDPVDHLPPLSLPSTDPAKSQLNSKDRGPKWAISSHHLQSRYYLSESILFYAASMKTMGQVLNRKIRGRLQDTEN